MQTLSKELAAKCTELYTVMCESLHTMKLLTAHISVRILQITDANFVMIVSAFLIVNKLHSLMLPIQGCVWNSTIGPVPVRKFRKIFCLKYE